ncbi:class I SAM-dependent methyltransferase [Candidatus Pelagibacter sp.]|nr:class I SAM-dependent methyltransferase [Candidatus Pelagibacter sp.]
MNNPNKCKWCKSNNISIINQAISKYKKNIYNFYYCHDCEIKFAFTKAKKNKIDYQKIQINHFGYINHNADNKWIKSMFDCKDQNFSIKQMYDFLSTKTMDQRYISAIDISQNAFIKKKKLEILEVGCNLGYVGALFIRQNHNYLGIDIQKKAINSAKKNYGNKNYINIKLENLHQKIKKKKFDLICSFEVIEHLEDPLNFILEIKKYLKKDGQILLTTPNGNFIPKDKWFSDRPPIHFSLFKEKTFKYLEKNNFKVKFLNNFRLSSNIFYSRKLFLNFNSKTIPSTDPENKNFIYSYKLEKRYYRKNFNLQRLVILIKTSLSFISSFFNISPFATELVINLKKTSNKS